ncbi:MAG: NepR family anti-sigma factor [Rhodomicrobiaceae bacterium]
MDAVANKRLRKPKPTETFIGRQIGSKLKKLYSEILAEPVPDRFFELIDRLNVGTQAGEGKPDDAGAAGGRSAPTSGKRSQKT